MSPQYGTSGEPVPVTSRGWGVALRARTPFSAQVGQQVAGEHGGGEQERAGEPAADRDVVGGGAPGRQRAAHLRGHLVDQPCAGDELAGHEQDERGGGRGDHDAAPQAEPAGARDHADGDGDRGEQDRGVPAEVVGAGGQFRADVAGVDRRRRAGREVESGVGGAAALPGAAGAAGGGGRGGRVGGGGGGRPAGGGGGRGGCRRTRGGSEGGRRSARARPPGGPAAAPPPPAGPFARAGPP